MMTLPHISSEFDHYEKVVVPRGVLQTAGATLKYYHIVLPGVPVPQPVDALARAAIAGNSEFGFAGDIGFCLLHRCGADFYFLLPTIWRGNNEAWEAVWYLQGEMAAFAPFEPAYPPAAAPPRPTFCVWELGAVAHEASAWARFLASPRNEQDFERWLEDRLEGAV